MQERDEVIMAKKFDFDREKEFVESNYNYVMSNCTNEKIIKNML